MIPYFFYTNRMQSNSIKIVKKFSLELLSKQSNLIFSFDYNNLNIIILSLCIREC